MESPSSFSLTKKRDSSGTAGISVSVILPLAGTGMPKISFFKIAVLSEWFNGIKI
jgi:hypothetical protein